LDQLEEKEKTAKEICVDCKEYGAQYGDVQKLVKDLLFGLNANINVIRENQNIIKSHQNLLKEQLNEPTIVQQTVISEQQLPEPSSNITLNTQEVIAEISETPTIKEVDETTILKQEHIQDEKSHETVDKSKPETQAIATQTTPDKPSTDNFMIIQSMNAEGETIQIYNMPHQDGKEDDKNVTVEAKYVRGHRGEPKRTSELVLKNVPKHFETTFVEPDETTTEIIVDPDGTKRIIVRKLTKTTHQIVNQLILEGEEFPDHLKAQLGSGSTTHDIIVRSGDSVALEQHPEITESSLSAVIEHISHRIIKKTRKIVKKITIIDGKEHITEEIVEEPDEVEEFFEDRPAIEYELSQTVIEEPIIEKTDIIVSEHTQLPQAIESIETEDVCVKEIAKEEEEIIKKLDEDVEVTETCIQDDVKEADISLNEEIVNTKDIKKDNESPSGTCVEDLKIETDLTSHPIEDIEKMVDQPEEKDIEQIVEKIEPLREHEQAFGSDEEPSAEKPSGEQVFKIVTEAHVDLTASIVDKLAPIENIDDIWPYSSPHITPQSAIEVDLPAQTEKYKDSESIWPQNLTIGSNIDFNEYSFERTLERSSDYLDNSSFNAGVDEDSEKHEDHTVQHKIDLKTEDNLVVIEKVEVVPKDDEHSKTIEFIKKEQYIQESLPNQEDVSKIDEDKISEYFVPEEIFLPREIETKHIEIQPEASQSETPEQTIPQNVVEDLSSEPITSEQIIPQNQEPIEKPTSAPVSPSKSVPQIATITIVKTMTFLEKEKANASELIPESIETRMIVKTPEPIEMKEEIPEEKSILKEEQDEISSDIILPVQQIEEIPSVDDTKPIIETSEATIFGAEVEEKLKEDEDREDLERSIIQEKPIEIDETDQLITIVNPDQTVLKDESIIIESRVDILDSECQEENNPEEIIIKEQIIKEESLEDFQDDEKSILPSKPDLKEEQVGEKSMIKETESQSEIIDEKISIQEFEDPKNIKDSELHDQPKTSDFETFQVVLKVDPMEVTKVNVNFTEESPLSSTPTEQITSPPESIEEVKSIIEEPTALEIIETPKEHEKLATDTSTIRSTGYEAEDRDESGDGKSKKKKKKDKKKKQIVKPEEIPSAIPKSTDASFVQDATSLVSSDNENVMPEEEHLPEGRETILSPDESYHSISENEQQSVKILEESIITSPDESIRSQPDTGIIYPTEVIEVIEVQFEDSEQQTEPVVLTESQQIREPTDIETKEIQTVLETVETETQMSPIVEKEFDFEPKLTKETIDSSMQTIVMKFIETESQTSEILISDDKKPLQEQEIQTEDISNVDMVEKQETSMQTIPIETIEQIAQTDIISDKTPEEDERNIVQEIVDEITYRAVEAPRPKFSTEEFLKSERTQISDDPKASIISMTDAETQTKKGKKTKKQKSKEDQTTELQIETIVTQPSKSEEKSHVTMTLTPETTLENIDVQIKIDTVTQNEPDNVLRRLNDIMNIETCEEPKENFSLSQNLNNLINSTDQKGFEAVPWSEVQYMIDTNIDNRRINNTYEFMTENVMEEPVDGKINESLQKIEQYINILPEVVNSNEEKVTQKTIIVITKVIVTCLEQIEYKIYRMKQQKEPTSDENNELNRLEALLQSLKDNVAPIENENLRSEITKCVDTLQQHVKLDQEVQEDVSNGIKNFYTELSSADDTIKRLQQETIILEDRYQYILQTDFPNDDRLKHLESLEVACKENKKSALRAIKMKNLSDDQSNTVKLCYDRTKDMEHVVRLEKRKLIQLINLSEEYVQTLNEFSQITLIANSLVDKTIVTNSLDHLQNEIQRHRKFFINLNHCRNILESLERNLDTETREKHSTLHNALYQKATNILEKAGERSQKLSLAASKWTVLDKRMKNEEQWLQVAKQRVPDLSSVTSADYEQYITLYQSLNSDLTMHQAKMYQNYETSIKLQELICAPNLETKCNDSLTKLVKIKEDVNTYLKRLIHFKQMWYEYNLNADKLEHWMNQVEEELNKIDIPENFMTYPVENMRNFWEIKAQYEFNHQIHKNVCENFDKSLKIISLADDKLQLQFYAQLDDRWHNITNRIDGIKNQITENISSTAPSYNDKLVFLENELDEILFIINNTKGIIRNPEELNLYIERLIVLRSRILVVENELVTIGFMSTTDTEKVGELCNKSHKISLSITEEMELADLCKGRLNTLRQEISMIREDQVDFYEHLTEFEGAAKLESAAIEKALEGCQISRENLVTHWKDIMRVRHLLHTLPTGLRMSVSPVDIEKEISQLEDDYVDIEKRLCEIESLLKNRSALWKRFEKQLEVIQQSIQETDFMVELLTVHGNIDYDRLLKATERLEVRSIFFKKIKHLV